MARHCPTLPSQLLSPLLLEQSCCTATSLTLLNGDVCHIGDWVLFSLSVGSVQGPALGRVREIIVSLEAVGTHQNPRPYAILIQQAAIASDWVKPYRMPRVSISDNWAAVNVEVSCPSSENHSDFLQHLLCSANVQHKCYDHHCAASGSTVVYQERQATDQTRAVIVHDAPEDLILNTARMHDAAHFSWHRFPIDLTSLNFSSAIMTGAQQEIDSRKRANISGQGLLARGRANGRGRGGSSTRNTPVFS